MTMIFDKKKNIAYLLFGLSLPSMVIIFLATKTVTGLAAASPVSAACEPMPTSAVHRATTDSFRFSMGNSVDD